MIQGSNIVYFFYLTINLIKNFNTILMLVCIRFYSDTNPYN